MSTCASTLDSRGGLPPAGLHAAAIGAELPGRALRHAREIVYDLRWLGMAVPPVYARMTEEFQTLVRSGAYTDWVASSQMAARWHVTRTRKPAIRAIGRGRGAGVETARPALGLERLTRIGYPC